MSKEKQGDLLEDQEPIIQEVEEVQDDVIKIPLTPQTIEDVRESEKKISVIQETPSKEIAVQSEIGNLLQLAITNKADMDVLERLITMKNAEEDRNCKKEFDLHFSKMQKEFEPIDRTKDGYNCKYAPLPHMIKKYGPIISDHGFAFRWKKAEIENGIRIIMVMTGWGYTDSDTFFDVPEIKPTGSQNLIQVGGTMVSYGERYTFKMGWGITEIDEDTDGNLTFEDGIQYAREIEWIRSCKTKEDLQKTMKEIWEEFANNKEGKDICTIEYNKKKAEIMENNNDTP